MSDTMNQELFERIESYVLDRMDANERELFEAEIAQDQALRQEVAAQRECIMAVEVGAFSAALVEVGRNYQQENPVIEPVNIKSVSNWSSMLRIAASIILLLGAGYFFLRPAQHERLYAEFHVVDPGLPVPMSATDDPEFFDAMVDFKQGLYEKALQKWSPMLEEEPNNDTLLYYVAHAQLNLGQDQEALAKFSELRSGTGSFVVQSEWYSVLAHLKLGNTEQVQDAVFSANSPYLEQLDELKNSLSN
jgi:tetratricopeptide (TPR) repeat protein